MVDSRRILWVDCTAALLAGVVVVALSGWLSRLHSLPQTLLLFIGMVNLLYAAFTLTLALQARRPMVLIRLLVFANATWGIACLGIAAYFWTQASIFGIAHLVGEAAFVSGLATIEWRQRYLLASNERPLVKEARQP